MWLHVEHMVDHMLGHMLDHMLDHMLNSLFRNTHKITNEILYELFWLDRIVSTWPPITTFHFMVCLPAYKKGFF